MFISNEKRIFRRCNRVKITLIYYVKRNFGPYNTVIERRNFYKSQKNYLFLK